MGASSRQTGSRIWALTNHNAGAPEIPHGDPLVVVLLLSLLSSRSPLLFFRAPRAPEITFPFTTDRQLTSSWPTLEGGGFQRDYLETENYR